MCRVKGLMCLAHSPQSHTVLHIKLKLLRQTVLRSSEENKILPNGFSSYFVFFFGLHKERLSGSNAAHCHAIDNYRPISILTLIIWSFAPFMYRQKIFFQENHLKNCTTTCTRSQNVLVLRVLENSLCFCRSSNAGCGTYTVE